MKISLANRQKAHLVNRIQNALNCSEEKAVELFPRVLPLLGQYPSVLDAINFLKGKDVQLN